MLKKISSFTLFLGILGSITCQGVSGAETTFKDKGSQVIPRETEKKDEVKTVDSEESKALDELKKVNFKKQDFKTEAAKTVSSETRAAENSSAAPANGAKQSANLNTDSKQPAVNGERLVLSSIDENYDVFFNWFLKDTGLYEYWYYLFHTYEGDEHSVAKKVVCILLLAYKLYNYVALSLVFFPVLLGTVLSMITFGFSDVNLLPVVFTCGLGLGFPIIHYLPLTVFLYSFIVSKQKNTSSEVGSVRASDSQIEEELIDQ